MQAVSLAVLVRMALLANLSDTAASRRPIQRSHCKGLI